MFSSTRTLGRCLIRNPNITFVFKKFLNSLQPNKRPFTVAVEGNIGSGKTTFLNNFSRHPDITIIDEPIKLWQNCNGINLLDLLYKDPNKWAFTFQSYVQLTLLELHLLKVPTPIKFMERSIFSARYCFVENMLHQNILPEPSYLVIHKWFEWVVAHKEVGLDLIIYLRTSPKVAWERMKSRDRNEESKVPLEYLQQLHDLHEDWLLKDTDKVRAPVLVIDGDCDLENVKAQMKLYEDIILNKGTKSMKTNY